MSQFDDTAAAARCKNYLPIASYPYGMQAAVKDKREARVYLRTLVGGSQKAGDEIGIQIREACAGYFPLCAVIVLKLLAARGVVIDFTDADIEEVVDPGVPYDDWSDGDG